MVEATDCKAARIIRRYHTGTLIASLTCARTPITRVTQMLSVSLRSRLTRSSCISGVTEFQVNPTSQLRRQTRVWIWIWIIIAKLQRILRQW